MYNNHFYCLPHYSMQSNPIRCYVRLCEWARKRAYVCKLCESGKRVRQSDARRYVVYAYCKVILFYIRCLDVLVASFLLILSSYSSSFVFATVCVCVFKREIPSFFLLAFDSSSSSPSFAFFCPFFCHFHFPFVYSARIYRIFVCCWARSSHILRTVRATIYLEWVFIFMLTSSFIRFSFCIHILVFVPCA